MPSACPDFIIKHTIIFNHVICFQSLGYAIDDCILFVCDYDFCNDFEFLQNLNSLRTYSDDCLFLSNVLATIKFN